ncbi:MAG: hypothetical protein AAB464_01250 [Patescibacteria group bacterium]
MAIERLNSEEKEIKDLLEELPKELQGKHGDKSADELRRIVEERKHAGSGFGEYTINKKGNVLTKKEEEEIKNRDPKEQE